MKDFIYFILIYIGIIFVTMYISDRIKADVYLIKKFKMGNTKKLLILELSLVVILYLLLVLIRALLPWTIDNLIITAISVGITMGLTIRVRRRLATQNSKKKR